MFEIRFAHQQCFIKLIKLSVSQTSIITGAEDEAAPPSLSSIEVSWWKFNNEISFVNSKKFKYLSNLTSLACPQKGVARGVLLEKDVNHFFPNSSCIKLFWLPSIKQASFAKVKLLWSRFRDIWLKNSSISPTLGLPWVWCCTSKYRYDKWDSS